MSSYPQLNFVCDICKYEFKSSRAYSPAPRLTQIDQHYTYCVECYINSIDKRNLKKTGRSHLFSTKVKKEWIKQLKAIAREEKIHYNELLERALACYDEHRK